jgi:hypothetical protein
MAFDYSCRFKKQGLGMGTDYNNARAKNTCTLVAKYGFLPIQEVIPRNYSTVFSQTFQFGCGSPTIAE